ncbi:MAG: Maf family protein [Lachnospiraceae bacterium]|nr:Maf family protein [Lachnospiraceae bacterium]
MNTTRIILASGSPRRKEILQKYNLDFTIEISDVDETHSDMSPAQLVEDLSYKKAMAVFNNHPEDIVIGADTVVAFNDEIFEKPIDDDDAYRMINLLQGDCHQVYTGVTICSPNNIVTFSEKTDVYVRDMNDYDIREYISSGEGNDKAGSYAIQGIFSKYIDRYEGDYENVVGLPGKRVTEELFKILK